jgi:hypothetical protein
MEGLGLTNQFVFVLYYLERKQYTNLSSVAMHCMHTFLFSTAANPQMISILSVASELARQHQLQVAAENSKEAHHRTSCFQMS